MEGKHVNKYDSQVVAELYDMNEDYNDDVLLIKKHILGKGKLNILECFTGTGRILLPMAEDGHRITGIDISSSMLQRAEQKLNKLDEAIQKNVTLINGDILEADWGKDYDLIILGCNAFYDLPSPELQEACIRRACAALKVGGYIYIDNNDYKGNWGKISCDTEWTIFEGILSDGTFGQMKLKHNSFDEQNNILDFSNVVLIRTVDGLEETKEYRRYKHPVTAGEVSGWLDKYKFEIINTYGDTQGNPYSKDSNRAIFWAVKSE